MKTVKVLRPWMGHDVGEVIQVREQAAKLLIPRGVVTEDVEGAEVKVVKAKKGKK